MISQVPLESLDPVWEQLLPMVERGLRRTNTTPRRLYEQIVREESVLWVVHEDEVVTAGVILSIVDQPKRRVVVNLLAGKDMDEWYDKLMSIVIDYRDLIGADCIEALCRPGMAKYLNKNGWKAKATLMEIR